jgi:hypothetical protein
MHAQADCVPVNHLHEAGIDTLRKTRVGFDQRADADDRRRVHIRHHLHGMRVAHGDGGNVDLNIADNERLHHCITGTDKRDFGR